LQNNLKKPPDNILAMETDYCVKRDEFISGLSDRMYCFEVTKCCHYSTFVFVYKDETLIDLHSRISHHFTSPDIKSLYIMNPQQNKIKIPNC
jgi:hypothetical protein